MRNLVLSILFIASAASAQEVDPLANFPANAITEVEQPHVPETPAAGKAGKVPASPASPANPTGPVSPLWPSNTVQVFVVACTQGNVQLIAPCRCTIQSLMQSMTHREFMEISSRNAMDKDIRYTAARQQCALKTKAQKKR